MGTPTKKAAAAKSASKPKGERNWTEYGNRLAAADRKAKTIAASEERVTAYHALCDRFNAGERTDELAKDIEQFAPAE